MANVMKSTLVGNPAIHDKEHGKPFTRFPETARIIAINRRSLGERATVTPRPRLESNRRQPNIAAVMRAAQNCRDAPANVFALGNH